MITSSFLRIFVMATAGALAVGCSGAQTPSNVGPAQHEPAMNQTLESTSALSFQKCQHSPGLEVVPCHLAFTKDRTKFISVEGAGSGYARLFDNCQRLATIADFSGPAWLVTPKKAKGICAAVFIYKSKFAILTIENEL